MSHLNGTARVAIVVQARQGSFRFPGKMLAPLAGKPVIQHVLERTLEVEGVCAVILATSQDASDEPLREFVRHHFRDNVLVCAGVANNVLHRFYQATRLALRPDYVVRLTGDCPLLDPRLVSRAIVESVRDQLPYNGVTNSPDGTDVEIVSFEALEGAYYFAHLEEVEHVTTWIRANRTGRSIESFPAYTDIHYSVNTIDDLRLCEHLIANCGEGARYQDHIDAIRALALGGKHVQR